MSDCQHAPAFQHPTRSTVVTAMSLSCIYAAQPYARLLVNIIMTLVHDTHCSSDPVALQEGAA